MFSRLSRTLIGAIIILFSFTAVYVPQKYNTVPKAEALEAVIDWAVLGQSTMARIQATLSTAFQGTIAKITSLTWWYDTVIKPLGWALAKAILHRMLKDIIRWINSGFKGSPMFVQDLGGFLTSAADEAAGRFIQEVGGPLSIVCSPFRLNIRIAIATAYSQSRDRNLRRCTLSGAMQNIQNFFDGDFNQGGWGTWLQIVHQPQQYTYLGQYYLAAAEASIAIEGARGERLELARWAGGFLWGETCRNITTPDGRVERKCEVNTPGVIVQEQLNKHLGAGYDSLVAADQINEVVNAFLQQVVTQALSGVNGLLGLGGNARYTNPSFNIDTYPDTIPTTATTTGAFTMEDSVRILTNYIALASSTASRPERQYSDDDAVQTKAEATAAEARALIPTLEGQLSTLQGIIARYNQATTTADQAEILQEYGTFSASLPSQVEVDNQRVLWDHGFSGMIDKPLDHVDRKTLREARTREEAFIALAQAAIAQYGRIGNPLPAQMEQVAIAQEKLPLAQENLSTLMGIISQYESGDRQDARNEYRSLREDLTDEDELTQARSDFEAVFGPLP